MPDDAAPRSGATDTGSPWHWALRRLARAAGVAVSYWAGGSVHEPPDETLRAVLTELGHDCDDEAAAARSLRVLRRRPWTQPIDPVAVAWATDGHTRTPAPRVTISARAHATPGLALALDDGTARRLSDPVWGGVADTDDGPRRRGTVGLPPDLPVGYHTLTIADGDDTAACTIVVAPDHAPPITDARRWGWMLQAYAQRSSASWGQGEFPDLGALAAWAAEDGADFLLINPVHAAAPVLPQQPSPYSPTSRRFVNPCYLRVQEVTGFVTLGPARQHAAEDLSAALGPRAERVDRDAVWRAKRPVLWELYRHRDAAERRRLQAFRADGGVTLQRFATFCALAEEHGVPFTAWPEALHDPRAEAVDAWAHQHDDAVGFHAWLQLLCCDQLRAAQDCARDAGMAIGVVHDLAVGVDPGGADVWSLPEAFARSMTVGAPPDAFNQQGQDWGQPPPLPEAMRSSAYTTQREVLATSLTVGGGLRIDHILGFSRLFWIPRGAGPSAGTYVQYPADELFAVLVLEAHRADAIVIGEDLGTVDDRVRTLLRRHGVAGSAVLWFERDDTTAHGRRRAADYPVSALASVTTHDLPTAAGWWDGSALQVRADLGLLDIGLADARDRLEQDQRSMRALLQAHGDLEPGDDDVRSRVVAMYRFLGATKAALVAVALWDGVGDTRQPNMPGTVDEYPNWRLPLARSGADGPAPVTVEDLVASPLVDDVVTAVHRARARGPAG
jgi:4-alpha-glucanotransferase